MFRINGGGSDPPAASASHFPSRHEADEHDVDVDDDGQRPSSSSFPSHEEEGTRSSSHHHNSSSSYYSTSQQSSSTHRSHSTTLAACALPRVISVTVPKRVDQPAGLTLQLRHPDYHATAAVVVVNNNKKKKNNKAKENADDDGGNRKENGGKEKKSASSSSRSSSSKKKAKGDATGGGGGKAASTVASTGVFVGSVSPQSPFHPSNNNLRLLSSSGGGETLLPGDEILTVNGRRANRDPKRAARMIRATTGGRLTIVASRGRERPALEGTSYLLVRLDDDDDDDAGGDCCLGIEFREGGSLVRVASLSTTTTGTGDDDDDDGGAASCPFARMGLRAGDALLGVDGYPVRSASDARRLITQAAAKAKRKNNVHSDDDGRNGNDGGGGERGGGEGRVVALLSYSFWDMRRRVLRDELSLGENDDDEDGGGGGRSNIWEASWSHERNDPKRTKEEKDDGGGGEFVVLRLANTSARFRLDFDEDTGTCSCPRPSRASRSRGNNNDDDDNEGRRRRRRREEKRHQHSYSHVVDDDDEGSSGDDSDSMDEARAAALDLLYRNHVQPAVSALNHRTWRRTRLLAAAVSGTDLGGASRGGGEGIGGDNDEGPKGGEVKEENNRRRERSSPAPVIVADPNEDDAPNREAQGGGRSPRTEFDRVRLLASAFAANTGEDAPRPHGHPSNGDDTARKEDIPARERVVGDHRARPRRATVDRDAARGTSMTATATKAKTTHTFHLRQSEVADRRASLPTADDDDDDDFDAAWAEEEQRAAGDVGTQRSSQPSEETRSNSEEKKKSTARTEVEIRGTTTRGRSPRPYHQATMEAERKGKTTTTMTRTRSPQPYQMDKVQIKPEAVERGTTFRRRRSPMPYQMESARTGANRNTERTSTGDGEGADLDDFQAQLGEARVFSRRDGQKLAVRRNGNAEGGDNPPAYAIQNERRRSSAKLRRRPSSLILDGYATKRVSALTAMSALSESDSSKSGTSTTSSTSSDDDDSSSSSSTDDDDSESGAAANDDDERRRPSISRAQHDDRRLSESTELVVYEGDKRPRRKPQSLPERRRSPAPKLKMRNGDVRTTYKVLPRVLGTGAFGTVRTCIHRRTNETLAIKSISKKGDAVRNHAVLLKNEIALVQRVNHKNVVRVADVVQDRDFIHIVMEVCGGGDLFDRIVGGGLRLGERRACEIVGSLLDAVAYMHDRNIVHRDLKAEHLMLSNSDIDSSPIKIIDFGLATTHDPRTDPPMTAFAGSAFTVAPEVVKRSYGKECDLWSVGVIAYFLLTQRMPFNANTDKEIFRKIVSGRFGYPKWAETGLSEKAKDFIDRLLVVNPKRRLTAQQALSHSWMREHNRSSLMDSIDSLALVPVPENAVVVRRQPHEPNEQRQPARRESHRRSRASATRAAIDRRNPRLNSKPTAAHRGGAGGVASSRKSSRRPLVQEP